MEPVTKSPLVKQVVLLFFSRELQLSCSSVSSLSVSATLRPFRTKACCDGIPALCSLPWLMCIASVQPRYNAEKRLGSFSNARWLKQSSKSWCEKAFIAKYLTTPAPDQTRKRFCHKGEGLGPIKQPIPFVARVGNDNFIIYARTRKLHMRNANTCGSNLCD